MRAILVAALVAACAFAAPGCRAGRGAGSRGGGDAVDMSIRQYQVIWTRGGKLGYLKTFAVAKADESAVTLHTVEDLEFRQRGWIANDGQAERFDYGPDRVREAYRAPFERTVLPLDTLENQIRRIFEIDPLTEIALRPAEAADIRK
jgi:hypothetical protein